MKLNVPSIWTPVTIGDFGAILTHLTGGRVQYLVSDEKPSTRAKGAYINTTSGVVAVGTRTLWVRATGNAAIDVAEVSTAVMLDKFTFHSEFIETNSNQSEYPLINFETMSIINNARILHGGAPTQIQVYLTQTVNINGVGVVMPPPIGTEFLVEVFTEDVGQVVGFVGVYDFSRDTIQFFQANEQPLRTLYTFKVLPDNDSVWGGGIALTGITKIQ